MATPKQIITTRTACPGGGLDIDTVIYSGETVGYVVRVPGSASLYTARDRSGAFIGEPLSSYDEAAAVVIQAA